MLWIEWSLVEPKRRGHRLRVVSWLASLSVLSLAHAGTSLSDPLTDGRILAFGGVLLLWFLIGYGLGMVVRRLVDSLALWVGIAVLILILFNAVQPNLISVNFQALANNSSTIIREGSNNLLTAITSNFVATAFFLLGLLFSRGDGKGDKK